MTDQVKYPRYYAELFSTVANQPDAHFLCDTMAVTALVIQYGDDLQAVIKDDGEGHIKVVQEFRRY